MARREAINGYLFIAPAVLGFVLWVAGPMLFSAWLSLTEWDLLSPPEFVGLSNYRTMLQDPLFWKSLRVTFYFTLVSVPLFQVLAFAVALLMNVKVRGHRALSHDLLPAEHRAGRRQRGALGLDLQLRVRPAQRRAARASGCRRCSGCRIRTRRCRR